MLDLGRRNYRKLELVRDGRVIATKVMPESSVRFEECSERFTLGEGSQKPHSEDWFEALKACLRGQTPGAPSGASGGK